LLELFTIWNTSVVNR